MLNSTEEKNHGQPSAETSRALILPRDIQVNPHRFATENAYRNGQRNVVRSDYRDISVGTSRGRELGITPLLLSGTTE